MALSLSPSQLYLRIECSGEEKVINEVESRANLFQVLVKRHIGRFICHCLSSKETWTEFPWSVPWSPFCSIFFSIFVDHGPKVWKSSMCCTKIYWNFFWEKKNYWNWINAINQKLTEVCEFSYNSSYHNKNLIFNNKLMFTPKFTFFQLMIFNFLPKKS